MTENRPKFISYKRSNFTTRLPVDFLYSPSHWWIEKEVSGTWKAGITRFSTRMLGEMVDFGMEIKPGGTFEPGEIIGWLEGFKAITDIYAVSEGELIEVNPVLEKELIRINRSPYLDGWIYRFTGRPDDHCMEVEAYRDLLDKTIDRILEQQKQENAE